MTSSAHHPPVTEQRLEQALRQMAQIISTHGQQYMPIFERIARDLAEARMRREMIAKVMASIEPPTIELTPIKSAA